MAKLNLSRRQFIKHCSIALSIIAAAPITKIVIPHITATAIIEGSKELNLAPRSKCWKDMILAIQPSGSFGAQDLCTFIKTEEAELSKEERGGFEWYDNSEI